MTAKIGDIIAIDRHVDGFFWQGDLRLLGIGVRSPKEITVIPPDVQPFRNMNGWEYHSAMVVEITHHPPQP